MPPARELAVPLSEYILEVGKDPSVNHEIRAKATATLNALRRSMKAGPRQMVPSPEELVSLIQNRRLTTIVFFLDDTFEEVSYDMTTTAAEATEVKKIPLFLQVP